MHIRAPIVGLALQYGKASKALNITFEFSNKYNEEVDDEVNNNGGHGRVFQVKKTHVGFDILWVRCP